MEENFVTHQAIYNAHREVVGYELLYKDDGPSDTSSAAQKSAHLITNTFIGIGLENLVGSNIAFINLSYEFFSHEHPIPMASYQVVLEVPGKCLDDDHTYAELLQLSRKGYTISLYDYRNYDKNVERLDCIDIVKLDLSDIDMQGLKEQSRFYRNHGKRLHIKGINSDSHQLLCSQLGVDYFQGEQYGPASDVFSKATICNHKVLHEIESSAGQHPDDLEAIARIVSQDVGLAYKLLRYINCASFAERAEIHSLQQALALIGIDNLKKWASLLLTATGHLTSHGILNTLPLIRAEMCREMARHHNAPPDAAYLVGLFSTLQEVMNEPLDDLLDSVTLDIDIAFALLFDEGPLGHILKQVRLCESGDWEALDTSEINIDDYKQSYQQALQFAQA